MKFLYSLLIATALAVPAAHADTSLHGSRATFLYNWHGYGFDRTTMYYLSPGLDDDQRAHLRAKAKGLGDTHIYLYTRSQDQRGSAGVPQGSWPGFKTKLAELNRAGLKPILWLTPESAHGFNGGGLASQKQYMQVLVNRLDSEVAGYVVCLECDDYWGPDTVTALVHHVKSLTSKPVGVHLNKGYGGLRSDPRYYRGVDYIYLQTHGADEAPDHAIETLRRAVASGIPVIAAEYSLKGESPLARALGDRMCRSGAVGTGTGRTVTVCGQQVQEEKEEQAEEEKRRKSKNDNTLLYAGLVGAAVYLINKHYDFVLPLEFTAEASDEATSFGVSKSLKLNDDSRVSLGFSHRFDVDEGAENRVMLRYRRDFH